MGVINDIFLASESELFNLNNEDLPLERFQGIEANGIDPVKIATLYSMLARVSFDQAIDEQPFVRAISEQEGPWISLVPDVLRDTLARLDDEKIQDIAKLWSETEEFKLDGWAYEDVNSLLAKLTHLARHAQGENLSIYLWSAL